MRAYKDYLILKAIAIISNKVAD